MQTAPFAADLPIPPADLLRRHHVHESIDNRFRACARLLQSLWRERQGLPIGKLQSRDGKARKLGSRLNPAAADAGRNFLSPEVALLVRREVAYRERGAFLEPGRLFGNLLSSMPLAFNVFAPAALDLRLAAKMLRPLLPQLDIKSVAAVRFEHSPARRDPAFTNDQSAFDIAIRYQRSDGQPGFIGFEVKYTETMTETPRTEPSARFLELASASGLYRHPEHAALRINPLQQLVREHVLAQASLARGDYAEATFVLLAPRHNHLAQRAAELYTAHLTEPADGRTRFVNIELETAIEAIGWAGRLDYASALHDRYCDWRHIDEAVGEALRRKADTWSLAGPPAASSPTLKLIPGARA